LWEGFNKFTGGKWKVNWEQVCHPTKLGASALDGYGFNGLKILKHGLDLKILVMKRIVKFS
jgi:hypothetical protein